MDYITTNIRLYKDDYQRLKNEAAQKRKSLASVIREKLSAQKQTRSKAEVAQLIKTLDEHAKRNAKKLKGFDSVKAIREIRYEGKW